MKEVDEIYESLWRSSHVNKEHIEFDVCVTVLLVTII